MAQDVTLRLDMTMEERFEFLFQSIASHDQQLGEIAANQAETGRQIAALKERMDQTDQLVKSGFERVQANFEKLELNMNRLAQAMMGLTEHTADHARRLENLEGRL